MFSQGVLRSLLMCVLASISFSVGAAPQTLNWLFAHGPEDKEVLNLIEKHSKKLSAKTKGSLQVQLKTLPDQNWQTARGWWVRWSEALKNLETGEADVAQIAVDELVGLEPLLEVFDLPFLFRNHAEIEKFITGPNGKLLLSKIESSSGGKFQALAFTYSGGFREIASTQPLRTAEDFKKLRMFEERRPTTAQAETMRNKSLRTWGVSFPPFHEDDSYYSFFDQGQINGILGPYKELMNIQAALKQKKFTYMTNDHVNLFVTVVIMKKDAFGKLTKANQVALTKEVVQMAEEERKLFVKEAEASKAQFVKAGGQIITMSDAEIEKLRAAAKPIYDEFSKTKNGSELLGKIAQF